ncbi:Class I triheme cytochrome c [Planctomycetales bacterium 10988]|nr:Class I triheme cytochrome c [Planctomycetales bacterium 10988]
MKQRLITLGVFLAVVGLGGILVVVLGLAPVQASSGHWPITKWFLEFSMSRSIATYSTGIKVPELDRPELVLKGAGHYETGCSPCHGSPTLRHPRVAANMLPQPPYLPEEVHHWDPAELFLITKHGIMLAGMPAFPSLKRDDEVWALVAFLQEYQEMEKEDYQKLVFGNTWNASQEGDALQEKLSDGTPLVVIQACIRCHGLQGEGRGQGAFPKLAGQNAEYLSRSLEAYINGDRHSGIMEPIAARLDVATIKMISDYYAGLELHTEESNDKQKALLESIERGKVIATEGLPNEEIPSCADCHGPGEVDISPKYPRLAGQYREYLVLQLELFHDRNRGGAEAAELMHEVADQLTESHREDVAAYYASLKRDDEGASSSGE